MEIGDRAFGFCRELTEVSIPESTARIGYGAFDYSQKLTAITVAPTNQNYSSLDGVLFNKERTTLLNYPNGKSGEYIIPQSVESIEQGAFADCDNLTKIHLPEGLTEIGYSAFSSCGNLNDITLPASLISIGNRAFSYCGNLTNISISANVVEIQDQAFNACSKLSNITVHPANPNYSSNKGVLFNKDLSVLIAFPSGKEGHYTTPNGTIKIAANSFSSSISLTSVSLNHGISRIEPGTFAYCTNLETIVIPESVTSIGYRAFENCPNLSNLILPKNLTSIENDALNYCDNLTSITLPQGLTHIGDRVFDFCNQLENIYVSQNNSIFSSLDGVLFNKQATKLVYYPAIREGPYTIPEGVSSIGRGAFSECNELTEVHFGTSVTSIEEWAFISCINLKKLYFYGNKPKTSYGEISDDPQGAIAYYKLGTTGWDSNFSSSYIVGIPTIGWHPANNYNSWIANYPAIDTQSGFNDDPDDDGLSNGLENLWGTDPTSPSLSLKVLETNENSISFTHPSMLPYAYLEASYEWSTDLREYYTQGAQSNDGSQSIKLTTETLPYTVETTTVTATPNDPTNTDNLFVRIGVKQIL